MAETEAKPQVDVVEDDGFGEVKTPPVPQPKPAKADAKAPVPPKMNVRAPNAPPVAPPMSPAPLDKAKIPELPIELRSKAKMVEYIQMWGYQPKDYDDLEYTEMEREAFTKYKALQTNRLVPKEIFTAALRMWHSGQFPLTKPTGNDLRSMKIDP